MGRDAQAFLFWGIPIDDDIQPEWWHEDRGDWGNHLANKAGLTWAAGTNYWQQVRDLSEPLKCDMHWFGSLEGENQWFAYPKDLFVNVDWSECRPVGITQLNDLVLSDHYYYRNLLVRFFEATDLRFEGEPRWHLTSNYG